MEVATKAVFFQHDTSTEQIHMFLPAATVIASIFYSLILRVCQPQGEAYKFQFAE
jgi:hypothetical protein